MNQNDFLTGKQELIVAYILKGAKEIFYGGSVGCGKTDVMARVFLSLAFQAPNCRFGIFRENLATLKVTTLDTFERVADEMEMSTYIRKLGSNPIWYFPNGSKILFRGIDEPKDRDLQKLGGLELTAMGYDEVPESSLKAYTTARSRVGRANKNGVPAFTMATGNPTNNWAKARFYDALKKGTLTERQKTILGLPEDNPFLSQEYLENLYSMPAGYVERFVKGNWEYLDDTSSLFKFKYFQSLRDDWLNAELAMGIDVAREGKDRSIICIMNRTTVIDFIHVNNSTLRELGNKVLEIAEQYNINHDMIGFDAVGVGAGLGEFISDKCYAYKSGAKANEAGYNMLRSESFYKLSLAMEREELKFYQGCSMLSEIEQELTAHSAVITPKVVKVTSKDEIKKDILHRSPDVADALSIAYSLFLRRKSRIFVGTV